MRLISGTILLAVLAVAQPVLARNIMTEQSEAASARDVLHDAENNLQDIQQKIQNQQQVVQREQDRLKQLQDQENNARNAISRAQQIYDEKAKQLEDAWQQRNN